MNRLKIYMFWIITVGFSCSLLYAQQEVEPDFPYFIQKADNYLKKGNLQNAIQLNEQLLNKLGALMDSKWRTDYYILYQQRLYALGSIYFIKQDYDKSLLYFKRQYHSQKRNTISPELYLALAKTYKEKDKLDSSVHFVELAVNSSSTIGDNATYQEAIVFKRNIQEIVLLNKNQKSQLFLLKAQQEQTQAELASQQAKNRAEDAKKQSITEKQAREKAEKERNRAERLAKKELAAKKEAQNQTQIARDVTKIAQNRFYWSVIIGVIALFFLVVSIISFIRQRLYTAQIRKQKESIEKQSQELTEKTQELEALAEELRQQTDTVQAQRDTLQEKNNEYEALTEELRQQTDVLENTNTELQNTQQLKDLMISAVNHDLRNPLNPILNFSKPDYPKYSDKERLGLIHQQASNMLALIEDIMNVYRADKLTVQPSPNAPHKAVEEAIQLISLAKNSKPAIRNEIPAELMANFDHGYIKRVFENFLSNAVKYTKSEEKGGWVRFFAEVQPDTQQVIVGVEDNGKGIPKNKFEEIFLPFVNPDARSIGGVKSVGIGLTFCKNIVEAHHSRIELESEEGKGTKFYFALPYIAPEEKKSSEEEGTLAIIQLSAEEKEAMAEYLLEIRKLGLRSAKLKGYLERMDVGDSERLKTWKESLIKVREKRDKVAFEEMTT